MSNKKKEKKKEKKKGENGKMVGEPLEKNSRER